MDKSTTAHQQRYVGGLGKVLEVLSLRQLGLQPRPVYLLNLRGYYDGLLELFARAQAEGFAHPLPPHLDQLMHVEVTPEAVVASIQRSFP